MCCLSSPPHPARHRRGAHNSSTADRPLHRRPPCLPLRAPRLLPPQSADYIDAPWSIGVERANAAGKLLAEALVEGAYGGRTRPVTLVGFSLGATVVHACLQALARAPGGRGQGIVNHAVLLGAAVSCSQSEWLRSRSVVSGRLVNGFSGGDMVLRFLGRVAVKVAGTQPVLGAAVENVDVGDLVGGHLKYPRSMGAIMRRLQLE